MIPRFWAVSPGNLRDADADSFLPAAGAAAQAGLAAILLREPGLSDRAYTRLAEALRSTYAGRLLCLHDRPHLVRRCAADALHLSFRGIPAHEARAMLPSSVLVGTSAHAEDAPGQHASADYCLLGPVRDTPSKRGWKEPLGFGGLADEAARLGRPAIAVGGLQPADVRAALLAGAAGVASLGGVWSGGDPAGRVREYLQACEAVKET